MKKHLFALAIAALMLPTATGQSDDILDDLDFSESGDEPRGRSIAEEASLDIEEEEDLSQPKVYYQEYETATLRALDKITGRSTDIDVRAGMPEVFGSLRVELKACFQTPPELPPESAAFLSIHSTQAVQVESMSDSIAASEVDTVGDENPQLFSGWMFASSPGLSALEHPVYDVWVINCTAAAPVSGASSE
ncbi:MAG: DUF2155 domain-containing protein [Pseudomonadota bacterium]